MAGRAKAQLQVPRTGYAGGEEVPFFLEIENRSHRVHTSSDMSRFDVFPVQVAVNSVSIRLLQFVSLHGRHSKSKRLGHWSD